MSQSLPLNPNLPGASLPPAAASRLKARRFNADALLAILSRCSAIAILAMMAALIVVLALASVPSVRTFGLSFITGSDWRPNELERPKIDAAGNVVMEAGEVVMDTIPPAFGALPLIYGTTVSSIIA